MTLRVSIRLAVLLVFAGSSTGMCLAQTARRELKVPPSNRAGFTRVVPIETGVQFTNYLGLDRYTTNQIYLNGSGVAAGDMDGDGWCDLYFCGLDGPNALYKNLGNWKFKEVATGAGVACESLSATGAAFADLDGDRDLDLVVNSIGQGTHIFVNDGKGSFTRRHLLNEGKGGMSLAIADYDGDSWLDLYICNYRTSTLRDQPGTNFRIEMVNGKPVVATINGEPATLPQYAGRYTLSPSGNISEHGEADALYRNDGKGGFVHVPFTGGAFLDEDGKPLSSPPYDWSLSAMFRDLNGDGRVDLYICNDFDSVDGIWMNQGAGRFKALSKSSLRNTSKFSMGVAVADIDRDWDDDLFVLDMLSRDHVTRLTRADKSMDPGGLDHRSQVTRNTLQLNRGDGTFAEVAFFAALAASEWAWTPIFTDVDLDGFEDLLVTAGHARDDMDIDNGLRIERTRRARKMPVAEELALRKSSPAIPSPLLAFRNIGGAQFEEAGPTWGFDALGVAHGMCLADLDNDGDHDVAINNLNALAAIYRNESNAPRVMVRLKGDRGNTQGIGAKILVRDGAVPIQSQEIICGGRYLSSDDPTRVFAAGSSTNMTIEVTWPTGKRSMVENVRPNEYLEVAESTAAPVKHEKEPGVQPLFEDASWLIAHVHQETFFDDFARQALLPNRLSQLGPAVAWFDLNEDGREELIIGGGRGGRIAVYRNEGGGRFAPTNIATFPVLTRDASAILGISRTDTSPLLLVATSSYEDGQTNRPGVVLHDIAIGEQNQLPAPPASSIGPMALADIEADGDLDLFIGGRVVPGEYPVPPSSMLLLSDNGKWALDEKNNPLLSQVGMISGAVWTDLDNDGFPELALACEWGPVKIFRNHRGHLEDATSEWGMADKIGWWNGITAGDFNGDGRMDLVASNWGINSKYRVTASHGARLYYANWGIAGQVEPIEAYFDEALRIWVPHRDLNSAGRAIPIIREKFPTHRSFAQATIEQILGDMMHRAHVLEANWLATTVFLNKGARFEAASLTHCAQYTPAFGINVADFNGDGNEDIFLSQNFFAVQPQTSRNDAGRGLLLKGNGDGTFAEMDGARSGIKIYGEQRGSAVADYDQDGRVDLVVSQNAAATTLWHNVRARPGLRVGLDGPAGKPNGIGAILRLRSGNGWGPAREIHAGSGYWSQDSAIHVMATPGEPRELEVKWPGGARTTMPLKPGSWEVIATYEGGTSRP